MVSEVADGVQQQQVQDNAMHLGYGSDRAEYTMNDNGVLVTLEAMSVEKDLGIWVDDKLKFSTHIGHAVAKGNQVLGLLKRSFVYKNSDISACLLHMSDLTWSMPM